MLQIAHVDLLLAYYLVEFEQTVQVLLGVFDVVHYYVYAAYGVHDLVVGALLVQQDRGEIPEMQHFLLFYADHRNRLLLLELADELFPHWGINITRLGGGCLL